MKYAYLFSFMGVSNVWDRSENDSDSMKLNYLLFIIIFSVILSRILSYLFVAQGKYYNDLGFGKSKIITIKWLLAWPSLLF